MMRAAVTLFLALIAYGGAFLGGWHASANFAILTAAEYAELVTARNVLQAIIRNPAQICKKDAW